MSVALVEMDHPQLAAPVQTDNDANPGTVNNATCQKHSGAVALHFSKQICCKAGAIRSRWKHGKHQTMKD